MFCERWDQSSFDPDYDMLPITFFAHMVHEVFARIPYDAAVTLSGVRAPLQDANVASQRAA